MPLLPLDQQQQRNRSAHSDLLLWACMQVAPLPFPTTPSNSTCLTTGLMSSRALVGSLCACPAAMALLLLLAARRTWEGSRHSGLPCTVLTAVRPLPSPASLIPHPATADNAPAFQRAINAAAAVATATNPVAVWIPPGNWTILQTVSISSSYVTLRGAGVSGWHGVGGLRAVHLHLRVGSSDGDANQLSFMPIHHAL